jgi:hypothetical protein
MLRLVLSPRQHDFLFRDRMPSVLLRGGVEVVELRTPTELFADFTSAGMCVRVCVPVATPPGVCI